MVPPSQGARPAAFFRLEGVMHPASAWAGAAYLASNAASMRQRLLGLGGAAMSGALRSSRLAGASATRLAYAGLEGLGQDRLEVISEDYARDVLVPEARPCAVRLLAGARRDGLVTVLLAESIAPIAEAFSRLLDVDGAPTSGSGAFDLVIANRMTLDPRSGATGKLLDPFVGPEIDPRRLRELAATHRLDLATSRGYGHARGDLVLLGAVGHPCVIEPDRELNRAARDLDWPVVHEARAFAGTPARRMEADDGDRTTTTKERALDG